MRHHDRHHHQRFRGPGDWLHGMPGAGGPFLGPPWAGGRRRMRRGHVRYALLVALADGPAHGYELMGKLEEKSGGMWHPSPGSIYPTLQLLEDEGLVTSQDRDGKRVYEITDAGREQAKTHAEHGGAPWEGSEEGAARFVSLRDAAFGLMGAAMQVAQAGREEQIEKAEAVLRDARKGIYQILAED